MSNDYINEDDLYKWGAKSMMEEVVILKRKIKEDYLSGIPITEICKRYRIDRLAVTQVTSNISDEDLEVC